MEQTTQSQEQWQQEIIEKMVFASITEQRRARRWRLVFRFIFLGIVIALAIAIFHSSSPATLKPHTAIIEIKGVIADGAKANSEHIIEGLTNAMDDPNTKAVILDINSPGGSPVQSGQVFDEIMRLRELHPETKVYAVCSDICASGAYYIASAANEIYADRASIVGSIGVLMNGFGFVDTMEKLGIERRLFTAGKYKGFLDPFSPLNKFEEKYNQTLLDAVHQQFIDSVKKGRQERLGNSPDLFTGLVWIGSDAVKFGLIDGLGSTRSVAREIIGEENFVDYTYYGGLLQRIAENLSTHFSGELISKLSHFDHLN